MKKRDSLYDNKIVHKPWGYEYTIFRYQNKLSITFLKINFNKKTSLHCHPKKKTGFILINGKAKIQLGLWRSNSKNYSSPSKLMIREGLFHSIKSISKKGLIALEFETPVNKKDLVRYKDNYGRTSRPYEGKEYLKKMSSNFIIFKKPKLNKNQRYLIGSVEIYVELHSNFKKLVKEKMNTIFAVLYGEVVDKYGRNVLSSGDIIRTGTLKKLSEVYKIRKKLALIKVKNRV